MTPLPDPFSLPVRVPSDDLPWAWRFRAAHGDYILAEDLGNGVEGIAQRVSRLPDGAWRTSGVSDPRGGLGEVGLTATWFTAAEAMRWATTSLIVAGWTETSPTVVAQVYEPCWRVVGDDVAVLVGRTHAAWASKQWVEVLTPDGGGVAWWRDDHGAALARAETLLRELDKPVIKAN